MTTIGNINSGSQVGMFQRPPMENYKMTDEQKTKLQDILSTYDAKNLTDEDKMSMMQEIRKAGIRPGDDLKTTLEDAGFDLTPPPPGGQPPMGAGGAGATGQTPQFLLDFVEKYESGEVSNDDIQQLVQTIKSQGQQTQGILFDQMI
jgi:hypothetical protein